MATKQERKEAAQNRLKAMNHPIRAEALLILYDRTASPAEIARELGGDVGKVSYHIRKLVEWGCAELVKTRPVRGAVEHFYRATEQHLVHTDEWEELSLQMKDHLIAEFAQTHIDEIVGSIKAGMLGSDENYHLTHTRHTVDAKGHQEVMEIFERARLEALEAEARSAERLASSKDEDGILITTLQGCFEVPPSKGGALRP